MSKWRWGFPFTKIQQRTRTAGECLLWTGGLSHRRYGTVLFEGRIWLVHRLFYTQLAGPIPDGYDLHHRCTNKTCVNVKHLLPVAHDQHAPVLDEKHCAFRTHCPKGHAYTPENTQWKFKPSKRQGTRYWKRRCRTCYNASNNRRRSRQRRHHLVAGA